MAHYSGIWGLRAAWITGALALGAAGCGGRLADDRLGTTPGSGGTGGAGSSVGGASAGLAGQAGAEQGGSVTGTAGGGAAGKSQGGAAGSTEAAGQAGAGGSCASGLLLCGLECVDPATDLAHCGACEKACAKPANATAACVAGECGVGTCDGGHADCDGSVANGCEVVLATDPLHCGACGNACDVGMTCHGATCAVTWAHANAFSHHTCATRSDGTLWCWGKNDYGQVGNGKIEWQHASPSRVGTETVWVQAAAGGIFSCATKKDGTLWCWGDNSSGQLGDGTFHAKPSLSPVQAGADSTWTQIAAGFDHVCALRADSSLWCWGRGYEGQLGDGTEIGSPSPVQVVPGTTWVQVSSGQDHTCATRSDGTLWCWGLNSEGRLGDGTTTNRLSPVQVVPGTTWAWVAGSQFHTCATRSDGTLWCWGKNDYGQLGDGTTTNRLSPVQVGTETTWARVAAGDQHSCATKKDGTLWCWGYNLSGQVGDNTGSMCLSPAEGQQYGESCLLPIQVGTDSGWDRISAGVAHTCATRTDGSLWCWGYSGNGQLGLGDAVLESHTPAMVTLPAK